MGSQAELGNQRVRTPTGVAMATNHGSGGPVFDWSPALTFVEGDAALLRDVLEAFLEECPVLMQTMAEAMVRRDASAMQRAAHMMAGALRMFGIEPAIDDAAQLEEMGRSNQFAHARACYADLKSHIDVLLPAATVYKRQGRDG